MRASYVLMGWGVLFCLATSTSANSTDNMSRNAPQAAGIPTPVVGGTLQRSLFFRMRDGTRLSTDIYFPSGELRNRSAIVMRTPYRKGNKDNEAWAHYFANKGFVVVVQDVRGRWESEGQYHFYSHDRSDFNDLAEQIAHMSWSNGRLGTFGCSYLGEIQIIQAGGESPYLKAILPEASSGGSGSADGRYRYFSGTMGGAYELLAGYSWFSKLGSTVFARLDPDLPRETYLNWIDRFEQYPPLPPEPEGKRLLWELPVKGLLDRAGYPPSNFDEFISTPLNDPVWKKRGFLSADTKVDVPALFVNGWYDYGVGETLSQYHVFKTQSASVRARQNQHLLISPATHCADPAAADSEAFMVGERPVGDTRFPLRSVFAQWFHHWLDRDGQGALPLARVYYYLMGKEEWRQARDMPVPGTRFTEFYLSAGPKGANGLAGDGALTVERPLRGMHQPSNYVYDPGHPSLIISGPLCCDFAGRRTGSFDQRQAEAGADTLVYTTAPLKSGLEVTGPLKLSLWISSDAPDTDFYGKVVDVYPDGRAFFVQEGILRARYREGFDKPVFMSPGQVYHVEVDLQATGNYFREGHRIRLEIASSHFPRFDRNLNTGGPQITETVGRIAHNQVLHDPAHPSALILPIVPRGASQRIAIGKLEAGLNFDPRTKSFGH